MRFVITVNIKTTDEPSGSSPLPAIILTALPLILEALNIKLPEPAEPEPDTDSKVSDTQPPTSL